MTGMAWLAERIARAAAALAVLLALSAPLLAQGAAAGILGVVRDQQGGILPGATITLRNEESGVTRVVVTEADGRYRFPALPPGRYALSAELAGFQAVEVRGITLTIGMELVRDFSLGLQTVQESVTVTGESPVVDTTKSEVAGVVTQQQIAALPINTRQYLQLALLMPGTSQDAVRPFYNNVNIGAGSTFYSSAFLVDNVTNTWAEQGEPRQNFPQDSVREFKVNTVQFKAEAGLATGGLVSVVTKSGTNNFDGNAFEYFRDAALNAKNTFETSKPDFRRHQFGASLGGPIVRDKMHFFAAVERTKTDEFFTVNTGRPQFYSAVEGTFAKPSHTNLYTVRSDAQLATNQTLFVRYAQEDEKRTCFQCGGNNAANAGFDQTIPRRAVVAGHTWVFSNRVVNDLRFQYAYSMYQIAPAGTEIFTQVGDYPPERVGLNRIQRRFSFPSLTYGGTFDELGPEDRWQFKDDFSVNLPDWHGAHDFRFGADYSYIPFKDDSPGNLGGTWTFGADQPFNPGDPASLAALINPILYTQQAFPLWDSVPTSHFAWYVQDDWKPVDNVTLNLGLRYDRQFGSFNEDLDPSSFPRPIPFIDPASRGDANNFGPRIGMAYDPRRNGRTVLRGGYGVYYDNIRTLANFFEWRNLRALTIVIPNPAYPDPFQGQDPIRFISTAPPNIGILSNDFENPYSHQYNVGLTRAIATDFAINVDGVYTKVRNDRIIRDLNPRDRATGVRPEPQWGRIDETASTSRSDYKALFVRLDKRYSRRTQFLLSYTLAKSEDNNPGNRITHQAQPDLDFGPSNVDRRHTIVASGSVLLPWEITLGAVWTYRSNLPFSARAGQDLDNDLFTTDYVPGTSRNQGNRGLDLSAVNAYRALFGLPTVSDSDIDSSRFSTVDVRATKSIPLPRGTRIELSAQVFNLLNTVNLIAPFQTGYVENARSASFGKILTAKPGTQAELGARVVW